MLLRIKSLLFHLMVIGYFWAAEWYVHSLKVLLPLWLQIIVGVMYLMGLLFFLFRNDLLLFAAKEKCLVAPVWLFFLRSFAYYIIALGLPMLLVLGREEMPYFISSYLIFIYFIVLVNCVDYAFPSYERYRKLISERKYFGFL